MAKIGVIEAHSDKVTRRVKKSVAALLVRRMLAYWEAERVIRMVPISAVSDVAPAYKAPIPSTPYIPAKLPPLETGGCKFQEPQSPTWREQHWAYGSRLRFFPDPVRG